MSRAAAVGSAIALVVAMAGCAKARAELVPDGPPLAIPAPPVRALAPVEEPLAAFPALPEVPVSTAPSATALPLGRPPAPATESEPRDPQPVPPVPPAEPAVAGPAGPPSQLRAAPAATDAAAERQIRELLARAARELSRTDYRKLTVEGRAQYDQSKRFADQAEEAIKERNLVFAQTLVDKAATLAGALGGG